MPYLKKKKKRHLRSSIYKSDTPDLSDNVDELRRQEHVLVDICYTFVCKY